MAEIATPFVSTKLARLAPGVVNVATEAKAPGVVGRVKSFVKPTNTPALAVAQVAQGQTKDITSVAYTLQTIDTKGVKTFKGLLVSVNDAIPKLSRTVEPSSKRTPRDTL